MIARNVYLYNPAGFNPLNYVPERLADSARILLHFVETVRAIHRNASELAFVDDDYTPLKARYLINLVGQQEFYPVRQALEHAAVIEIDHSYIKGERSKGYKVGAQFAKAKWVRVRLTNQTAIDRIRTAHQAVYPKLRKPVHRHLKAWLGRLAIQHDEAQAWLDKQGLDDDDYRSKALSLALLRDRDFYFKVDRTGRIHTNVTNLWSPLRQFLRVDGQRLAMLDIANSQPLLFALLFNHSPSPILNDYNQSHKRGRKPRKNMSETPILDADTIKYLELVQQGQFYDHMRALLNVPEADHKQFKRDFFGKVFYCKSTYNTPERKAFSEAFPQVFQRLQELKAEDYRNAPLSLQHAEANLVIGQVCERLRIDHPTIPVLTLHDAILTTPDHAATVYETFMQEFKKHDLTPTIRTETPPTEAKPKPKAKPNKKEPLRTTLRAFTEGAIPLDTPCEVFVSVVGPVHLLRFDAPSEEETNLIPERVKERWHIWPRKDGTRYALVDWYRPKL